MKKLILALLVGLSMTLSFTSLGQTAEEQEVINTIQSFFDAMAEKDTATLSSLMHPKGVYFVTQEGKSARVNTHEAYVKNFPMGKEYDFKEEMWDPQVLINGDMAVLWAPYNFYLNGKFEHCGIDNFSLIKENGKWVIATTVFSISKTPCN